MNTFAHKCRVECGSKVMMCFLLKNYREYTLKIQAADMKGEGRAVFGTAVITVTDSNDNAPKFAKNLVRQCLISISLVSVGFSAALEMNICSKSLNTLRFFKLLQFLIKKKKILMQTFSPPPVQCVCPRG